MQFEWPRRVCRKLKKCRKIKSAFLNSFFTKIILVKTRFCYLFCFFIEDTDIKQKHDDKTLFYVEYFCNQKTILDISKILKPTMVVILKKQLYVIVFY